MTFYDERIEAGRARAYRRTLMLAACILIAYAVLHGLYLYYEDVYLNYLLRDDKSFHPLTIAVEALSGLSALVILLIGELSHIGAGRDELVKSRKEAYYRKAFFVFLYIFAGIYCVFAPIQTIASRGSFTLQNMISVNQPYRVPATVLGLVMGPCWWYLLMQFKRDDMPINVSVLAEETAVYRKAVITRIRCFGFTCAGFTLLGIFSGQIYTRATHSLDSSHRTAFLLAILMAGVLVFGYMTLHYLLFSAAERVSDAARQKGILSRISFLFFCLWAGSLIVYSIWPCINTVLIPPQICSDIGGRALIALLFAPAERGIELFRPLALVYLLSELSEKKDKYIRFVFTGFVVLWIAYDLLYVFYPMLGGALTDPSSRFTASRTTLWGMQKGEFENALFRMSSVCIRIYEFLLVALNGLLFERLFRRRLVSGWLWTAPALNICLFLFEPSGWQCRTNTDTIIIMVIYTAIKVAAVALSIVVVYRVFRSLRVHPLTENAD